MIRSVHFCLILSLGWLAMAEEPVTRGQKAKMVGFLGEEPGSVYVLREGEELNLIAQLQPGRFRNENFAKYVGCKVEVSGRLTASSPERVIRVERIRPADANCKPKTRGWRTESDLEPAPR